MKADIAVSLITVNRAPGRNYLDDTLKNLCRGNTFSCPRLHSFTVYNGDQNREWFPQAQNLWDSHPLVRLESAHTRLKPTENAWRALAATSELGAKWTLFLEDDIDVCADFLGSIGRWLDLHEGRAVLYSFGAAYDQITAACGAGKDCWLYPVSAFYGTTCFAMLSEDAQDLASYWGDHIQQYTYDLQVGQWMGLRHPAINSHLASAPCFVQHIGQGSVMPLQRKKVITYPWAGPNWSYV